MMITCADSGMIPELITGLGPGDMFVARNPGALVPVYSKRIAAGMSASIEFAIKVLDVKHIVVCGHSDCGAMKATLYPENVTAVPAVSRWLRFSAPALDLLSENEQNAPPKRRLEALTKHCVRVQLGHLVSHPSVRQAIDANDITLSAAYYDIGSGRISRVAASTNGNR